jgi:hypothetical protein
LHYKELGLATLTSYFVNANKDPKKGNRVSPADFFYFKPESSTDINPDVASTFFSLATDKLVPNWAASLIPIKDFVAIKDKGRVSKLRGYVSDSLDVFILSPSKAPYQLFCGFLVIFELDTVANPYIDLHSIDNPEDKIKVVTPSTNTPQQLLNMSHSNYYLTIL